MKDLDINNPEHKEAIQAILRQGVKGEFWKIISGKLEETVEALTSQMESSDFANLPAAEYKVSMEILKSQKRDRLDIISMPEDFVRELDNPEFFKQDRDKDVYPEKEDFEK